MDRNTIYDKWLQLQNYIIIGVVSLVALFFLPMIGSTVGLEWSLPNTLVGWIVYVVSKLLVAGLNIVIFHCFILQAKVNVQDNKQYIKACEIMRNVKDEKELSPRSPSQYLKGLYGRKGTSIFISSIIAAVGLTQAVLTFDWVSMLTYFFTILMGIIFGILQMNQTELYWTEEYLSYATEVERTIAEQNAAVAKESLEMVETPHIE